MKDWKAAARNWANREKEKPVKTVKNSFDYVDQRRYSAEDLKELERKLLRRT